MEEINDLQLDSLPVELLLYIFCHCDINDMINLSCVCTRFYYILRDNFIWPVQYNEFIKKQTSDRFLARCHQLLPSYLRKTVTHLNWVLARFQLTKYSFYSRDKQLESPSEINIYMKHLKISRNELWGTVNNALFKFNRTENGLQWDNEYVTNSEFCSFNLCDNGIISGHQDGTLNKWIIKNNIYIPVNVDKHSCAINAVDASPNNQILISGADDGTVKIQNYNNEINILKRPSLVTKDHKVRSLAIDPLGTKCVISYKSGSIFYNSYNCIIPDIDRGSTYQYSFYEPDDYDRFCKSIPEIVWENDRTFLTIHEEGWIIKWDLRLDSCVYKWRLPRTTLGVLNCISSDYQYTMVTSTTRNQIFLWDQRKDTFIQYYRTRSKALLSLQFDNRSMYVSTNQSIQEFNFEHNYKSKELSRIVYRKIKFPVL